ncbi:MAG: carboxypeptidase regulatory-like domain-containing protein [Myxococcales bacterium]|nr:carboxypeptidase regulatory-like domain-containing protein [Myxococcales bacterium]
MRARRVLIAIGALALAVAAGWWRWPSDELVGAAPPATEAGSPGTPPQQPWAHDVPRVLEGSDGGLWGFTGVVRDENGAPAGGATITAHFAADFPLLERTCDACGRTILWCGAPVSVRDVLSLLRAGKGQPPVVATVTADAQGRFTLDGLEARPMVLIATAGARRGSLELDEVPEPGREVEVAVNPVQRREVTLVTEDKSPLGPVRVVLYGVTTGDSAEVQTDAAGRATFELVGDSVWIGLDVPGWLPVSQVQTENGAITLTRPRSLVVRTMMGGRPVEADVELELHGSLVRRSRGGEVRFEELSEDDGQVRAFTGELASERRYVSLGGLRTEVTLELRRAATLEVSVVDAAGQEIEEPWVDLSGPSASAGVVPEEEGAVRFTGVPEGEYTLQVHAEGFRDASQQVDLAPGPNQVRVMLQRSGRLTGVVVDEAGQPVADAVVELASELASELTTAQTGDDGRFELEVVDLGDTPLSAWSAEAGSGKALARPGQEVTIRLRAGATLELELIDLDGQRVAQSVELQHTETGVHRFGQTGDPVGRVAGLEPGSWSVLITYPGRLPISQTVTLAPDQVLRLTFRLDAGEAVEGRVLEANGSPVEGAQVVGGGPTTAATTDAQGRFELHGLPKGEVTLMAIAPEGSRSASAALIAPARGVELRFEEQLHVTGRVVDEAGRPVQQYMLERSDVNDPSGRFDLHVPRGRSYVTATNFQSTTVEIDREGDLGTVTIKRLPALRGEVLADGRPVPGAQVTAVETLDETVSDAEGRFELPISTDSLEPVQVVASRGALSGRAEAQANGPALQIALTRGTQVLGRVVDGTGAPLITQVELSLQDQARELIVSTDAQGRFEVNLLSGTWAMTPRNGASRYFPVSGARQEVTIVDSRACTLVLDGPAADSAWLVAPGAAAQADWLTGEDVPAGSIAILLDSHGGMTAPCGPFELVTLTGGVVARQPVKLEPGRTQVQLAPPPEPVAVPE